MEKEKNEEAIVLRDFITYVRNNKIQNTLRNIIKNYKSEKERKILRKLLKQYLNKSFYRSIRDINEKIYDHLITEMSPSIIKNQKVIYSNFILLSTTENSTVYECTMEKNNISKQIIVKCYKFQYGGIEDTAEEYEFILLKLLNEKKMNVPKIYPPFKSDHFNCYPMEKIPQTLNVFLKEQKIGLDVNQMINILQSVVPILQVLHEYGYLYVDFSFTNLGIKNQTFYMFDFGSVVKINSQYEGQFLIHTALTSSIKTMEEGIISIYDDFESIGFLLIYSLSPLKALFEPNIESKIQARDNALKGIYGDFIKEYFNLISNLDVNNIYSQILNLCLKYSNKSSNEKVNKSSNEKVNKSPAKRVKKSPTEKAKKSPAKRVKKSPTEKAKKSPAKRVKKSPAKRVKKSPAKKVNKSPAKRVKKSPAKKANKSPAKKVKKSKIDFYNMSVKELIQITRDLNIKGRSAYKTKKDLIELLEGYDF